MAIKKPFVVKKSQPINSAHDFTLKREEWEWAVFQNAMYFSVIVFQEATRWRSESESLPEALANAAQFERRLVYAVTHTGRSVLLPEDKWEACLEDWYKRKGEKSG